MVNMEQLGIAGRASARRRDFPKENRESSNPSHTRYQRKDLTPHFSVLPEGNSAYP